MRNYAAFILGLLLLFLCGTVDASPFHSSRFIINKGQWNDKVRFKTQIGSHQIWLQDQALTYQLINASLHPMAQVHALRFHESPDTSKHVAHVFTVRFQGANVVKPQAAGSADKTRFNFYLGNDPKKWQSNVPSFEAVRYQNLYNGIDLQIKSGDQFLKYDFELAAGNDGRQIEMDFQGDHGVELKGGRLRIHTTLGVLEEHIPKAYQLKDGVAHEVECHYTLKGKKVGFRFTKPLDLRYPTVIDPLLNFFTYSGAASDNWANTAISDKEGNSYTAGTIYGSSFPTTNGAFDRTYSDTTFLTNPYFVYDVGIMKFNSTGSELLFCTFLGGQGVETPHSLAIDENQDLVILGSTSSLNFPVSSNAFQKNLKGGPIEYPFGSFLGVVTPTYGNGCDLFVAKLNSSGQELIASTYLGGIGTDGIMSVVENLVPNYGDQFRGEVMIDTDGSVYIASHTHSPDFPLVDPSQSELRGNMDGLVVKMNSGLSGIVWSTLYGGNGEDAFFSIKSQNATQIVLCGGTNSTNLKMPASTYQRNKSGAGIDAFIVVFNKVTGDWVRSTYSGTTADDQAFIVETDDEGAIYMFGQTKGEMPRTSGTYGQQRGGQFLQKFRPDLSSLFWSTTFGPTPLQPNIVPTSLMVDSCERIFMAGWGGNVNYRGDGFTGGYTFGMDVTSDAFQSISADSSDFYFLVLSKDARSQIFGSYLGAVSRRGEHVDGGTSKFDKRGTITQAVCGCRDQNNRFYRGTTGAYKTNIGSGNCNNGVMKLNLFDLKVKFQFAGIIKCPASLTLTNNSENGDLYTWYFGNGDSLQSNSRIVSYTYKNPGKYIIMLKAVNPRSCVYQAVAIDSIVVPDPFNITKDYPPDSFCVGEEIKPEFPELAGYTLNWVPQNYLDDPTSYKPVIKPLGSTRYKIYVTNQDGCVSSVTYGVQNREINLGFGIDKQFNPCEGSYKIRYFSNRDSSDRYVWYFGDSDSATGPVVERTYSSNDTIPVRLNGLKGTCEENAFDTLRLNDRKISVLPAFAVSRSYEGCEQPYYVFQNSTVNGDAFIWDFGDGVKSTEMNPRHQYSKPGLYDVKLDAFKQGCLETTIQKLRVNEFSVPNLITLNDDLKNDLFIINGLEEGWVLDIYNRWGKSVYQSSSYKNDWKPDLLEAGVYFYNIRFPGNYHCNGWVELVKE